MITGEEPRPTTTPIQVVLVTHYFSTHRGGVERVAGQLAARLARTGRFKVTWFASDCDPLPAGSEGLCFEAVPAHNFLERHGFPWPIWPLRSLMRLRRAIMEADIVHFHDFIYFGSLAAFLVARRNRKPIVITQHIGDIPYNSVLLRSTIRAINRTIGRLVLGNADQVVFISEAVRKDLSLFTTYCRPSIRIPNGVDTETFYPVDATDRESVRAGLGMDSDQRVVLYVGRFVDKKGLPLLRDLAATMPDLSWWFAGWGSIESESHPSNWNLPNVTVFEGRSGATLAELYRAADLLVLPSISEGFPLVVQEAMGCGTRALVTTAVVDGAPEAAELLLTCPIDPPESAIPAWRKAIRSALDQDLDDALRMRLVEFVRAHWAWDLSVAGYHALFDDVLRNRKSC